MELKLQEIRCAARLAALSSDVKQALEVLDSQA